MKHILIPGILSATALLTLAGQTATEAMGNQRPWHLAAKGDLGGFGVDFDFTWNLQGSVGYRYFDTDQSDSSFPCDAARSGAVI